VVRLALDHGRARAERAIQAQAKRTRAATRAAAEPQGLLIAEGDSWFDYPFLDVLGALEDGFGYEVESVAHQGDTVEEMAYNPSQVAGLATKLRKLSEAGDRIPRAILLSGGGNDVAGDEFPVLLNHKESGLAALNEGIVKGMLEERLLFAVVSLASQATALSQKYFEGRTTPILLHGYDYPVPDGRGFLGGFWLLPGPWLEPGFRQKGYDVMAQRCEIMVDLIDRFNAVLEAVPTHPELRHVKYVNLRGTLSNQLAGKRYKDWWANELHPTEDGFRAVAAKLDAAIRPFPIP
jgi:lysophospholipase L1-like esterase